MKILVYSGIHTAFGELSMHLDKRHPRPVYLQLKEMLQSKIEQGYYLPHQKLPSERDLCQTYDLSRMTARKALQSLIADGLAYTQAGKGTFVSNKIGIFSANMRQYSETDFYANNAAYRKKLVEPLLAFDCVGIEQAISEVLAAHPVETVASRLFPAIITELEQQWQAGVVSLQAHNYAITTLRSHLIAMVNATTMPQTGPKVLLGCAPEDQHEIGLLLLALSLRRRGVLVVYMGPSFTSEDFYHVIETAAPQLICLSAATEQAVDELQSVIDRCKGKVNIEPDNNSGEKPLVAFGGVALTRKPQLIPQIPGVFLGNSIEKAVATIQQLVH